MHLPLLYPRYPGDLGLPHSFGGFTIQETSPAAQAHAQPYLHIAEWEERLSFLSSLPPPMCPQPLSFYDGASLGYPQEMAFLSQPNAPPFWKALLTVLSEELPVQIGAMGGEGSHPSLPQGVIWDLNKENCAGLGDRKGLTSHPGSETY